MIVAAVDDLLFSSKIRATARQLGIDVSFARTPGAILEQGHAKPDLVIFDLNSAVTDPLGTLAALKRELPDVRVVAFASHVQTDVIAAARRAGADEVMPRSMFAANLAQILQSTQGPEDPTTQGPKDPRTCK
jgi:DNA-binding NarL/FixJ family response regulator